MCAASASRERRRLTTGPSESDAASAESRLATSCAGRSPTASGVPLPDAQKVRREDLRVVRARRYCDPFGVLVEHVDGGVVHDAVVPAAAMVVLLLDGDAELLQQRLEIRIGRRDAEKLGIEALQISGDLLGRVAARIDADEQHTRREARSPLRDVGA